MACRAPEVHAVTVTDVKTMKKMTAAERRAILSLSGAYALRMLGLYLALPILSPYAAELPGGATFWVGMAVGVYGIGQAIFQMPFGIMSDHVGRRPTILLGLALFGVGSLVGALARTAPVLVAGRFLQGVGAISSVVVAAVADLTRDDVRQRAMTMLGVNIGIAFGLGLVLGPLVADWLGVPGLFYVSALLAVLALVTTFLFVPEPPASPHDPRPTFKQTISVFKDPVLFRINVAMVCLHLGITAIFVVLPLQIEKFLPRAELWKTYAPVIGTGLLGMLATAELVDRFRLNKEALLAGASLLALGSTILRLGFDSHTGLFWGLLVFVLGFAIVEPILPALVTQYASTRVRGTAAGAFNMSQFSGAGLGGIAGAWFLARNPADLFWMVAFLGTIIVVLSSTLTNPRSFRWFEVPTAPVTPERWPRIQEKLLSHPGVRDAVYDPGGPLVRFKYVDGKTTEERLREYAGELS
jgi:MFS family permease